MDKESKICMGCNARKKCPPQQRADRITSGINQGEIPPEEQPGELSTLRKVILIYGCPPGEGSRLVEPLQRRVHPSRNPLFNGKIVPARLGTDVDYRADSIAANLELHSRIRGVKARRTTR